ncbi:hypothetical protein P879_03474 [Paragonimus westermani]|uniref:Uncharacterized protein n=1 Tax=Paragonimus westermani TaxID=34504 RepID=A0A8T0DCV5_9TREM|nr:hypothetical protein P879_03474 [Paragonimus westermani]
MQAVGDVSVESTAIFLLSSDIKMTSPALESIHSMDQHVQRIQQQLMELRKAAVGSSPEGELTNKPHSLE